MNKKIKYGFIGKIMYLFIFLLIVFVIVFYNNAFKIYTVSQAQLGHRNNENIQIDKFEYTAKEIVEDMKIGWNLGNSLDSRDGKNRKVEDYSTVKEYTDSYESLSTAVTTEEMINYVKEAGFNAVRLPVTWRDHLYLDQDGNKQKNTDWYQFIADLNESDMSKEEKFREIEKIKIEPVWLDRVEEVVHWVIDRDMYCIINVHHDVGAEKIFRGNNIKPWIYATAQADAQKGELYQKALEVLWTQIAERFKAYNANLLFEGFNEIRIDKLGYDQNGNKLIGAGYRASDLAIPTLKTVNQLNQVFVNAVRNTGENNEKRFLIVNTYLAQLSDESFYKKNEKDGLEYNFAKPDDKKIDGTEIENHIIMEVHYYDHYAQYTDENEDIANTNSTLYKLKLLSDKSEELGMPAIIGEFASYLDKYKDDDPQVSNIQVCKALNYYVRKAKELGITCFLWDDAGDRYGQLINREKKLIKSGEVTDEDELRWIYPQTIYSIFKGYNEQEIEIEIDDLINLEILSEPLKKEYVEGQNFDRSGLQLQATYYVRNPDDGTYVVNPESGTPTTITKIINSDDENITIKLSNEDNGNVSIIGEDETFSMNTNSVNIYYTEKGKIRAKTSDENNIDEKNISLTKKVTQPITVTEKALTGIEITKAPTKTSYIEGQNFDKAGIEVTATYNNGSTKIITATDANLSVTGGENLTPDKTSVTISYTENGVTKEVNLEISVIKDYEIDFKEYIQIKKDENSYITNITPGTTLKKMITNLNTNGTILVYKDNNDITDTDMKIATGMKLKVSYIDRIYEYTIVVKGDANGDGEADIKDMLSINKHRLGKVLLENEYELAGDVNMDNKVDIRDLLQINKFRLEKIDSL